MKLIIIGAGNVATRLSLAMEKVGMFVSQIYSHSEEHARLLGERLYCAWTTNIDKIMHDGDVYIFALKDDALCDAISRMHTRGGLWIHTSGSMPFDVFKEKTDSYGVLYPLQTLSKSRDVDFSKIPLFIEGNTKKSEEKICQIALKLSGNKFENIHYLSSEKRKYLHLAAVFACNFSNHMYELASQILKNEDIDWKVMQPLIDETTNKIHSLSPADAQTGPAMRFDRNIIENHANMIEDTKIREIYLKISKSIHETAINRYDKL